ncbi:MAG: hypothetical protein ACYDHC_10440 [Desulfuromonadaceae bacterium]
MIKINNSAALFVFLLTFSSLIHGCSATIVPYQNDGVPILMQDELIRPYTTVGRIKVIRESYGGDYLITPDIQAWGHSAIQQEAYKMGADAVMLPEVTGRTTTYGIIPSTEYSATGFAIKFK